MRAKWSVHKVIRNGHNRYSTFRMDSNTKLKQRRNETMFTFLKGIVTGTICMEVRLHLKGTKSLVYFMLMILKFQ